MTRTRMASTMQSSVPLPHGTPFPDAPAASRVATRSLLSRGLREELYAHSDGIRNTYWSHLRVSKRRVLSNN